MIKIKCVNLVNDAKKDGKEIDRVSGAFQSLQLKAWVKRQL